MSNVTKAITWLNSAIRLLTSAKAIRFYLFLLNAIHISVLLGWMALVYGAKFSYRAGIAVRSFLVWLDALISTFVWKQQELSPVYALPEPTPSTVEGVPDPWELLPPVVAGLPALGWGTELVKPLLLLPPAKTVEKVAGRKSSGAGKSGAKAGTKGRSPSKSKKATKQKVA